MNVSLKAVLPIVMFFEALLVAVGTFTAYACVRMRACETHIRIWEHLQHPGVIY